jgi:hypothetical protein
MLEVKVDFLLPESKLPFHLSTSLDVLDGLQQKPEITRLFLDA